jgi:hypothetical protein
MPEVGFRHDRRQIIVPAAVLAPEDGSPFRFHRVRALIDTGATMSGIRREVADAVGLPRQGKIVITTPSGEHPARLYRMRIGLYPALGEDVSATEQPYVLPDSFLAIQSSPGEAFDMLLGMDVLGRCDLHVLASGFGTIQLPHA